LSLVFGFGVTAMAQADLWQFIVSMDGTQEVPSNGSAGSGFANAILDDVSGAMSVNGNFSGLGSNVTMAHLHGPAPAGANAGVIFGLTITNSTSGTFSGNSVLSGANIANALGGLTYLNIHTSGFPGGEIRGQLSNPISVPEPGTLALLAMAGLAALTHGRRSRRDWKEQFNLKIMNHLAKFGQVVFLLFNSMRHCHQRICQCSF
jgi:hypothetical protein